MNKNNLEQRVIQEGIYRVIFNNLKYLDQTPYEKIISFANDNNLAYRELDSKDALHKFKTITVITKDNYIFHFDCYKHNGKLQGFYIGRKVIV